MKSFNKIETQNVEAPIMKEGANEAAGASKQMQLKALEESHDAAITEDDIAFLASFDANPERKAAVIRKVDLHVLPVLILLYLIAFLDRGNIGNAKIQGLPQELNLSSQQFNWCLTMFFFAYGPTEIPINIMIKLVRPSIWLPAIMFTWGVVLTLQGLVNNYSGLLATRWFLGMAEAGFFPGAVFTLSNWYLRGEMGRRVAYLYGSASLAGAFAGILAYGIGKLDGVANMRGWRWLFILEGIVTVLISLVIPFILPDSIERSSWLDADEKRYLARRIHQDRQGRDKGPFKMLYVRQVAADIKIWLMCGIFVANGIATYGLSFTLPSIINELGYTAANSQLLTIPPYAAAALCTFLTASIADKSRNRCRWIVIPVSVAVCGFIVVIAAPKKGLPGILLFGVFLIAMGMYSSVPAIIAWNANNVGGEWKRAIATGLQIGLASSGGIVGSNIYLAREAPNYHTGYGLSMAVLVTSVVFALMNMYLCKRENRRRDKMSLEEIKKRYTEDELAEMGDESPLFRFEH